MYLGFTTQRTLCAVGLAVLLLFCCVFFALEARLAAEHEEFRRSLSPLCSPAHSLSTLPVSRVPRQQTKFPTYALPIHDCTPALPTASFPLYASSTSFVTNRSTCSTLTGFSAGSTPSCTPPLSLATHCASHVSAPVPHLLTKRNGTDEFDPHRSPPPYSSNSNHSIAHLHHAQHLLVRQRDIAERVGSLGVLKKVVGVVRREEDEVRECGERLRVSADREGSASARINLEQKNAQSHAGVHARNLCPSLPIVVDRI